MIKLTHPGKISPQQQIERLQMPETEPEKDKMALETYQYTGGVFMNNMRDRSIVYSAINRCVSLIANSLSAMPIQVWTTSNSKKGSHRLLESPFYDLFAPHSIVDGIRTYDSFMNTLAIDMLLTGNAYAYVVRDDKGELMGLSLLEPSSITIEYGTMRTGILNNYQYVYSNSETPMRFMPEEIIHIKMPQMHSRSLGNPLANRLRTVNKRLADEDVKGTSPLVSLANILEIGVNAEEFINDYFKTGLGSTLAIVYEKPPDEQKRSDLAKFMRTQQQSADRRMPLLLSGNTTITKISGDAQSATLSDLRKQNVQDVCRIFGVMPFMIGEEQTTTWGSGIAEMFRGFYKMTVHPMASHIANQLTAKLGGGEVVFRLDHEVLTRESPKEEAEFVRSLMGSNNYPPMISQEEGRRWLDLGPANPDETWFVPQAFREDAESQETPKKDGKEKKEEKDERKRA